VKVNHQRDPVLRAYGELCRSVGSPYALAAFSLMEKGDYVSLSKLDIDPSAYSNHRAFQLDYAVYAYVRKYRGFPGADARALEQEAKLDFEKIEQKCRLVNFLARYRGLERGVEGVISTARRKIFDILGEFSFKKALRGCEWGPGATSTLKRRDAQLDKKILERRLSVTPRALRYALAYLENDLHWSMARIPACEGLCCPLLSEFEVTSNSRFTTVEKTVAKRRVIDIQPTFNLFLQKGVGDYFRKRLQKFGIDLDDQSRNQALARLALSDGLATIDLSNASDSISSEIVRLLLPQSWFNYLDDLRTTHTLIDGKSVKLEKFSAMGNGFTFELESLIFYAISYAVASELGMECTATIAVYGDDIIVNSSMATRLIEALSECGFSVNVDKTFTSGRFYESCGKHYYDGIEVTPVYQKELIDCASAGIRMCNRVMRLAHTIGVDFLDSVCWNMYQTCVSTLGWAAQIRGPYWLEGYGFLKDPYYRPRADRNGSFKIREFRRLTMKRQLLDHAPLLATSLRKGVVVDFPFKGKVDNGITRDSLCRRLAFLQHIDVPVWANSVSW
jgi:hypothetical protein